MPGHRAAHPAATPAFPGQPRVHTGSSRTVTSRPGRVISRDPRDDARLRVLLAALTTEEEPATNQGNQQNNRSDTLHNKPPR